MKKINILLFILISMIGFSSCQEDETGPVINSKAQDGTLTFVLNESRYSNVTYELEITNEGKDMDALTCVQPDYGFTAAVTYTTQVCFTDAFAAGTFQSLPTSINGEKVGINTKEMDIAIIGLYGGKLPDPVVERKIYVRLQAVVSDAMQTPTDSVFTVKPLFSNVISLKIRPYVLPLFPFTEVTTKPWYIIGLADGKWTNAAEGLGSSLIPLSITSGKKYNLNGDGEFVYTGYIQASSGFKLISTIGAWTDQWGNQGVDGIDKPISKAANGADPANFKVPADGYYTITFNSVDNTCTIVAATTTPADHTAKGVGLIGNITTWSSDIVMTPAETTNNHIWYTTYTFTSNASEATDGGVKFRELANWDVSWGSVNFPYGIGNPGGANIMYKTGTYVIIFNDVDGCYYFIKK